MHTITLESTTVEVLDNIDEIPAERWFQFVYLFSLNVGVNPENLPSFFASLAKQISTGNKDEALTQLRNMQIAFSNALNKVDIASSCLSQLFHSIDNVVITDHTESNLSSIVSTLKQKGLKLSHLQPVINTVKKKLMPSFAEEDY